MKDNDRLSLIRNWEVLTRLSAIKVDFSKISSALLFLFSNNLMFVIRADIHKMIVSIARSDCLICVCTVYLSLFGKQLVVEILVHLPYLQLRIIAEIMQKYLLFFWKKTKV